jgi:hypothetical protein
MKLVTAISLLSITGGTLATNHNLEVQQLSSSVPAHVAQPTSTAHALVQSPVHTIAPTTIHNMAPGTTTMAGYTASIASPSAHAGPVTHTVSYRQMQTTRDILLIDMDR